MTPFATLLIVATLTQHGVEVQPLEVCTPQFTAVFESNWTQLIEVRTTLYGDRIVPNPAYTRDWWQHPALAHLTLEADDYTGSGMDRGHVFALQWASGDDWEACNCMAFIVPQHPGTNRGPIKAVEQHITKLASTHGHVDLIVQIEYGDEPPVRLPRADEPCRIPVAFVYWVTYKDTAEVYRVPNVKAPASNRAEPYRVQ